MNPVATRLTKDHAELDALLERLEQDAEAPVPGALAATWEVFETKLLRHMEAEERYLLPLLEATDHPEVMRIRREHAAIRNRLAEIGLAIELHVARETSIAQLVKLLREHAKHEDSILYRLAGDKASSVVEHDIAELLKHGAKVVRSVVSPRTAEDAPDERARP